MIRFLVLTLGIVLLSVSPAPALIQAKLSFTSLYGHAKHVLVGTVAKVDVDKQVVTLKVDDLVKGQSPGAEILLQIGEPAELIKGVQPGQRAALFLPDDKGRAPNLVHLADTWLLAVPVAGAKQPLWRTTGRHDIADTFPGRTSALVRHLGEWKSGKPSFVEVTNHHLNLRALKPLATVRGKPLAIAAGDVNHDGKADLLVVTDQGPALFLATEGGVEEATAKWELKGAAARHAAFADVNLDGKLDLLLGKTLWLNDGSRFTAAAPLALPAEDDLLAITLADLTGDQKPDAVALLKTGELLVLENAGTQTWKPQPRRLLWKDGEPALAAQFGPWGDNGDVNVAVERGRCGTPLKPYTQPRNNGDTHVMVVRANGVTRYPLNDQGCPPADLLRLTGKPELPHRNGPNQPVATSAVDMDGDGRPDFYAACADARDICLMNRGFGGFFANHEVGYGKAKAKLAALCGGDISGDGIPKMIVATADGQLLVGISTWKPQPPR